MNIWSFAPSNWCAACQTISQPHGDAVGSGEITAWRPQGRQRAGGLQRPLRQHCGGEFHGAHGGSGAEDLEQREAPGSSWASTGETGLKVGKKRGVREVSEDHVSVADGAVRGSRVGAEYPGLGDQNLVRLRRRSANKRQYRDVRLGSAAPGSEVAGG
jgi:hypothetical protein